MRSSWKFVGCLAGVLCAGCGEDVPTATAQAVVPSSVSCSATEECVEQLGDPHECFANRCRKICPAVPRPAACEGTLEFSQPIETKRNGLASTLVAGDLNGDCALDLVSFGAEQKSLWVYLGNGDGTFGRELSYDGGGQDGVVADFNADGLLDVAVSPPSISILLGNGDGSLSEPKMYPGDQFAGTLVSGDFDLDGDVDLACLDYLEVRVLLGNGDGTFEVGATVAVAQAWWFSSGDFDGDGMADLATLGVEGSILLGDGSGGFEALPGALQEYQQTNLATLESGDLEGDGTDDLAFVDFDAGQAVSSFRSNGDGTFGAIRREGVTDAHSVATADFDGNGSVDIVASQKDQGGLTMLATNSQGLWTQTRLAENITAGPMTAGDFNSDGLLDLAFGKVNGYGDTLDVILQSACLEP